jgi:hypothetical protein
MKNNESATKCWKETKEIAARLDTQKQGLDKGFEKRLHALTVFLANQEKPDIQDLAAKEGS